MTPAEEIPISDAYEGAPGPVLVITSYDLATGVHDAFMALSGALRQARRRTGAIEWRLPGLYRSSVFAVDSRGFGKEIDSLPNDEDAGAGSLVISPARCAATARAALHVPNRRVTTLAAGHSP